MSDPGPGDAGCTEDGMAYCIVCGHEASVKTYLKHIERCIIRVIRKLSILIVQFKAVWPNKSKWNWYNCTTFIFFYID